MEQIESNDVEIEMRDATGTARKHLDLIERAMLGDRQFDDPLKRQEALSDWNIKRELLEQLMAEKEDSCYRAFAHFLNGLFRELFDPESLRDRQAIHRSYLACLESKESSAVLKDLTRIRLLGLLLQEKGLYHPEAVKEANGLIELHRDTGLLEELECVLEDGRARTWNNNRKPGR